MRNFCVIVLIGVYKKGVLSLCIKEVWIAVRDGSVCKRFVSNTCIRILSSKIKHSLRDLTISHEYFFLAMITSAKGIDSKMWWRKEKRLLLNVILPWFPRDADRLIDDWKDVSAQNMTHWHWQRDGETPLSSNIYQLSPVANPLSSVNKIPLWRFPFRMTKTNLKSARPDATVK